MAILIPSKNIYDSSNPKLVENAINSVTIIPSVATRNDNLIVVDSLNFEQGNSAIELNDIINAEENGYLTNISYVATYNGTDDGYNYLFVQKRNENKYIKSCDVFFDSSSLSAKITPLKTGATVLEDKYYNDAIKTYQTNGFNGEIKYNFTSSLNIPSLGNKFLFHEFSIIFSGGKFIIQVRVTQEDTNDVVLNVTKTLNLTDIIVTEQSDAFELKIRTPKFLSINYYWNLSNIGRGFGGNLWNGAKIEIDISNISLKAKQNISSFLITNGDKIVIGNTNEINNYKVEHTPFIQLNNGEIDSSVISSINDTLLQYSNGKETAVILCSISDYYDEAKNIIISKDGSTNKMLFEIYDEVCPLMLNNKGYDTPMSYTANNLPKTFIVIGSKVYYDGAIWQELTLQEFSRLSDLAYIVSDEENYAICSGVGVIPSTQINIPYYAFVGYKQYIVKEIGDYAFANNQDILTLNTGNGVIIIGLESFYNCKNMTSLTIGENVETIFDSAFEGCEKIEELIIPNNVKDIFTYAFKGCTGITNLTIGENVDSIGDYAFSGLTSANNIYYNTTSPSYISPTSFLGTSGMLIIGDKVELIPRMAFASSNITHLEMPYNGVCHTIEYGAFESCSTLQSIRIPKTVTKIEAYAFYGTSIKNIYYEGSLDDWSLITLSYEGNNEIDYSQFPEKFHFYS